MPICSLTLVSCRAVQIGPTIEQNYIFVHPGRPVKIAENKQVQVLYEGQKEPVLLDVGGWYTMPPEHWAEVQKAVRKNGFKIVKSTRVVTIVGAELLIWTKGAKRAIKKDLKGFISMPPDVWAAVDKVLNSKRIKKKVVPAKKPEDVRGA